MNNLRSTLLVAVTAFVAAACGDKVTVQGPTSATATVKSVTVAPASATLNIGDQITLTAAVNADAGLATTVTWKSSDATKASVDASGNVKGLAATPGVAVCATSTVDTGKLGCASVIVTANAAPPAVVAATVSIASITTAGNLNAPVNPAAVVGTIDVKLNIAPGNQTPSRVDLLVGTTVVASQGFTATQAAALRSAADEAVAAQSAFPSVVLSFNTAAFNATTGAPKWLNGTFTLGAKLYTAQGGATVAAANATQSLTFANIDTYVSSILTSGTTANALSATGFRYDRGGLSVSVLPVLYTGAAFGAGSMSFGSAACDASLTGVRTIALTAPAAGSTAWTATLPQAIPTGGAAVNTVNNYEFNGCIVSNAAGEGITVTATSAAGNTLFAAAAPAAQNTFRLDNRGPGAPTFNANPNGRQNGWINANVLTSSSGAGSATTNRWMISGTADAGVGGYRAGTRVGAGTVALALAATRDTLGTIPAPTAANLTLCAVASATDLLGNESVLPASATVCNAPVVATSTGVGTLLSHQTFGVDIAAPTIAFAGGLGINGRLNGANVGAEFQVTVSDTGIVGNSGMLSGNSVVGTVIIRNASALSPVCFIGTGASCSNASINAAPAYPLVPTTTVAASVTTGYYTYTAASQDAAGNQSAVVSRVTAYDAAANVPALTTAVYGTPLTGPSVTFSANASDNFDLWTVTYNLTYAGPVLPGPIVYPAVVLNTYNVAPLVNTNVPAGITIPNFVRQVEVVTGNAPLAAAGGPQKPNSLSGVAVDQVGNPSTAAVTGIAPASVTTGVSYLVALAPQLANSWAVTAPAAATPISNGAAPVPANATSVTLVADVFGPTATFNPPFARVDFYAFFGGNLVQIGSTTAYSTVDNGAPQGRRHRYSISWTPGTSVGVGATQIYAIGVNAAGDALVSPVNGNITITNP